MNGVLKASVSAGSSHLGDGAERSSRKARRLEHSPGLGEVVLLVDHDDPVGIHQAIRHEARYRRGDRDGLEAQSSGSFHETREAILLLEKARHDRGIKLAARWIEGRPCFDLPARIRAERLGP